MDTDNSKRPFHLLDTRNLRQERLAIVDAIQECLTLARASEPVPIRDYGRYRAPNWRGEDGDLQAHLSVDWYIADAWNMAKEKLNATQLMKTVSEEPWRKEELLGDHYDIWLVDQELYDESSIEHDASVAGLSLPEVGMVISMRLFEKLGLPTYSLLKTAAMHHLGHLFGLPDMSRDDVQFDSGVHCGNPCTMRSVACSVEDWLTLTDLRLTHGPYCEQCLGDLRTEFQTKHV